MQLMLEDASDDEAEQCGKLVLQQLAANLGLSKIDGITWHQVVEAANSSSPPPRRTSTPASSHGRNARPTRLPEAAPSSETLDFSKIAIPAPGLHIVADHREPQAIVDQLRQAPNVTVTVEALAVGDFRCDNLIFERKVISDFEQSVVNGRLFDEATRIALEPDSVGFVILEGDMMQGRSLLLQARTATRNAVAAPRRDAAPQGHCRLKTDSR